MKLHFESDLPYQAAAIEAVCDLFRGQEVCRSEFTVTMRALTTRPLVPEVESAELFPGTVPQQMTLEGVQETDQGGIGNRLTLLDDEIADNLGSIQVRNGLPQHGADTQACQAAAAVMRYFNTAGNNHHADEEENLFPLLRLRAGNEPRTAPLIAELLHDHERMTAARTIVLGQLERVVSGDAKALLRADVEAMSAIYRTHIAHENTELLPLAARVLTPDDMQQLSRAMTARRQ